MRGIWILGVLVVFCSCEEVECIDCVDQQGSRFTFCDPPEAPFANLQCGETYKK